MERNADTEFILEDGKYICGWAVEKCRIDVQRG